jgi:hypothetical protein
VGADGEKIASKPSARAASRSVDLGVELDRHPEVGDPLDLGVEDGRGNR